ncbi:MAG: hypothetical protein WCK70_20285 [Chloroflexales bacterium]|jgi:hypothetical protein
MARIIIGTRRLRYEAQQKTGERLSTRAAAEGITAKMREISGDPSAEIGRARLTNYELGKIFEVKTLELMGICAYYSEILGRPIGTSDVLEYDPANNKRALDLVSLAA